MMKMIPTINAGLLSLLLLLVSLTEGFLIEPSTLTTTTTSPSFSVPHPSIFVVSTKKKNYLPITTTTTTTTTQLQVLSNNNNDNESAGGGGGGGQQMDPELKLLLCILIDLVGIVSFAAPGLGEATDVAWAPISAVLVNYLFGNGIFTALAFVEELLPGLDIIPTATIAWFIENGDRLEQQQQQQQQSTTTTKANNSGPSQQQQQQQQNPNTTTAAANNNDSSRRPNVKDDVIDVEVID